MTLEIKKKDNLKLNLELRNINVSFVNALRRIILSEVETVGFNTDDYINSDLKIKENTTSAHNEFILHRLGLIPIHIKNIESFNPNKLKFSLKKENIGTVPINVTSGDFIVTDTETGEVKNTDDYFPVNPLTKSHITIITLKPNPNNKGEKIHVEGFCSKSNGKQNARYSPVCQASFKNKRDPEKVTQALEDYMEKNSQKEDTQKKLKSIALDFELGHADRYFFTDENNEANQFEMTIESIGVFEPEEILYKALKVLKNKLVRFKDNLNSSVVNNQSVENVSIMETLDTMKAFDITIENESHTLGYLLQTYAVKYFNVDELLFIGYKNPHPLLNKIVLKISTSKHTMEEVNRIVDVTCNNILNLIELFMREVNKKYNIEDTGKKTSLKIKKKK